MRRYTERMADEGIDASVSATGDSYDNPLVGTIIDLFKTEVIHHHRPWKERERRHDRQLKESGEAA